MGQRQVNLRLDEELLERVDRERGLVPRNAWIAQSVRRALLLESEREARTPLEEVLARPSDEAPAAPSADKPYKCPACSFRSFSFKDSCPTHDRSLKLG